MLYVLISYTSYSGEFLGPGFRQQVYIESASWVQFFWGYKSSELLLLMIAMVVKERL